ncbi:MAG: serine/threonine-protein kinase [Planctomycetaceae bacterium]|jgi:eukaryotic-like serine/threonine-protein kinase|nr:serine/threonine-protein kinase [Planctomycetaceae bacterium]
MLQFLKSLFDKNPRIQKVDLTKRFELIGRVGQGSMSKVWRARDSMTGRMVALKILDKEKTDKLNNRFKGLNKPTESEIATSLNHPNIVKTIETGFTLEKEEFLVMEFVEGSSLSFFIETQNETMQQHRLNFMIELGDAIEHFHSQKWIHRDICPRNVLVSTDNHIKLIDFGLAVPNTPDFQQPGNRTGTANYMAPELIKRKKTDERIDIFSYAVTCYEMWCKKSPWPEGNSLEAVVQHINNPPDPMSAHYPEIDPTLENFIMKGLARDPGDRWSNIRQMTDRLREIAPDISNIKPSPRPD